MVELTLHSGRNRIVRRMMDAVGHPVVDLVRRSFGPLNLGTLRSGAHAAVDLGRARPAAHDSAVPAETAGTTEPTRRTTT